MPTEVATDTVRHNAIVFHILNLAFQEQSESMEQGSTHALTYPEFETEDIRAKL